MILRLIGSSVYCWFPVLPFLAYWTVGYLTFHFGPFQTPELNFVTHIYFLLCLILFIVAYKVGLGGRTTQEAVNYSGDNTTALLLLRRTVWLTFIGAFLLLVDRVTSGAGSLDLVQNEMANIRQDYAENTTIITTLAVVPQSFYLVTLASYFYCLTRRLAIPAIVHILILLTLLFEIINMVLWANRGALFWIGTYVIFYAIFCARIDVFKELFSKKYIFKKIFFILFCIFSLMYFLIVAKNREIDTTAIYLGVEASYLLKDQLVENTEDYADLGARRQLFYYITHGFEYLDVILQNAPLLNLDLLSPLGLRIEVQIARFLPGYIFPAKENILRWVASAGLSPFGWPTTFGASLAYFGVLGSVAFFVFLGFISGYSTRRWLESNRLGWLIIVFTIYASLNMSFDWIIRNFDQYVAVCIGAYLIWSRSRPSLSWQRRESL